MSDINWDECEHGWQEDISSVSGNGAHCVKCGVPGEINRATGEIYWPAT
jgi:hypothetical protein